MTMLEVETRICWCVHYYLLKIEWREEMGGEGETETALIFPYMYFALFYSHAWRGQNVAFLTEICDLWAWPWEKKEKARYTVRSDGKRERLNIFCPIAWNHIKLVNFFISVYFRGLSLSLYLHLYLSHFVSFFFFMTPPSAKVTEDGIFPSLKWWLRKVFAGVTLSALEDDLDLPLSLGTRRRVWPRNPAIEIDGPIG